MKTRSRKITSLLLAGSILATGAAGIGMSSAMAHDNGGTQGAARQARAGHQMPAAVATAVKSLLGVDDAALAAARQAGTSLTALAQQKGIARDTLVTTIFNALKANRPANAPARTDAQITAKAGHIADHVPGQGGRRADGVRTAVEGAIAQAIGVSADELKTARQAGTSPATLAQQKGVSRDTVVTAVVAALKANKPADAPDLTDAQLTEMAGRVVDNARPGHGPGGHGSHRR